MISIIGDILQGLLFLATWVVGIIGIAFLFFAEGKTMEVVRTWVCGIVFILFLLGICWSIGNSF